MSENIEITLSFFNSFSLRENSKKVMVEIGDKIRTDEGWMTVEGFDYLYKGEDDPRTGSLIIDGRYDDQEYFEDHGSWAYAEHDVREVKKAS